MSLRTRRGGSEDLPPEVWERAVASLGVSEWDGAVRQRVEEMIDGVCGRGDKAALAAEVETAEAASIQWLTSATGTQPSREVLDNLHQVAVALRAGMRPGPAAAELITEAAQHLALPT